MAVADYFDRVQQSAAQVLSNHDDAAFRARLEGASVGIAFDTEAENSAEARVCIELVTRLMARLFPVIAMKGPEDGKLIYELRTLASAINPKIDLVDTLGDETETIVLGATPAAHGRAVYLGSDRWIARLSRVAPLPSGNSGIPFGAAAAACIGVANVFRSVFADLLPSGGPDDSVTFSTLGHETRKSCSNADLPTDADLGQVQLVGAGAIGQAAVWALAKTSGLAGHLDVIDHERTDLSNLQRYVLTERKDDDARKVRLAEAAFPGMGSITAVGHFGTWAEYLAVRNSFDFDLVATALDSAKDRVAVQGALPRRIANAWTQPGDCGVSRHAFLGEGACLACLYLPRGQRPSENEVLAVELGMPEKAKEIATMLETDTRVTEDFLGEVADRTGADGMALRAFTGLSLRDFRRRAVCGGEIPSAAGAHDASLQVPMAFQSAMAGVLLAAEIVAFQCMGREADGSKSVIDLLRPFPDRLTVPQSKDRTGEARCICEDRDFQRTYRRKYPLVAQI